MVSRGLREARRERLISVQQANGFSSHTRRKVAVILVVLALAASAVLAGVLLSVPSNQANGVISHTTSLFATNQTVVVNDNATTGIIVTITGESLSNSSYFTVTTTNYQGHCPKGLNTLATGGTAAQGYYDVKISANVTLTADVTAKVMITNPKFGQTSTMYYWKTPTGIWVPVTTTFEPEQTVISVFAAADLAGTPLGVGDGGYGNGETASPQATLTPDLPTQTATHPNSTSSEAPGHPFEAPEYALGALLALLSCLAALAAIKARHVR